MLRWVDPPTTALQAQRRVESWLDDGDYRKRYTPIPLARISNHLPHAVIAAEDGRFLQHRGIDWQAVREAVDDNRERGEVWRGGSTLTQQLVKNLFLGTRGGLARKAFEVPLAYMAEAILPKRRILELYLNVIEWGPGVFGAEAAAHHHFAVSSARLDREMAAGLAACIPSPRHYTPERMSHYRATILRRMGQSGW